LNLATFRELYNKSVSDLIFEKLRRLYNLSCKDTENLKETLKYYKKNNKFNNDSFEDFCRYYAPKWLSNYDFPKPNDNNKNEKKKNEEYVIKQDSKRVKQRKQNIEKSKKEVLESLPEECITEIKHLERKIKYQKETSFDIANNEIIHSDKPSNKTLKNLVNKPKKKKK